jgi:hypothetical protein
VVIDSYDHRPPISVIDEFEACAEWQSSMSSREVLGIKFSPDARREPC